MELHLKIIGYMFIVLGCLHVGFPKYFDWKNDLKSLQLINRQMMIIHTFFIGLTVVLMGVLCVASSADLISTPLGRQVMGGFAVFWSVRLLIQFVGYSKELWQGKPFETVVHIVFSCFWLYICVVFWSVALAEL